MSTRSPVRGPGSNQHQDKAPLPPRDASATAVLDEHTIDDPFEADAPLFIQSNALLGHFDGLDEEQYAAATHPLDGSSALVEARAGSGKTEVLTSRYALLADQGVDPNRVACLTFTNKAGEEMNTRAAALVEGFDADEASVGTFHSLGASIIDEDPEFFGRQQGWTVYDDKQQAALLKSICKDHDELDLNPRQVAQDISEAKTALRTPADLDLTDPQQAALAKVWEEYEGRLEAANAVDYDDLITLPVHGANRSEAFAADLAGRYDHVLVDEFQDVNAAQVALIDTLTGRGETAAVFAVGDPRQSIYGFRHADPKALADFQRRYGATHHELTTNYRSGDSVCRITDAIIDPHGESRPTRGARAGGSPVTVVEAYDPVEEAAFVADWAAQGDGTTAVLARTNADLDAVAKQLAERGVPYVRRDRDGGGKGEDAAMAMLHSRTNPMDDQATAAMLANAPGIGKTTIERLEAHAKAQGCSLRDVLADPEAAGVKGAAKNKVAALTDELSQMRGLSDDEFIQAASSKGLLGKLKDNEAVQVANLASQRAAHGGDTTEFLRDRALMSADEADDAIPGTVALSTVHAAKGLGYDRVAVVGMDDKTFPMGAAAGPEVDEERRIAYVAASRAKDELLLSHTQTKTRFGKPQQADRSRFLSGAEDAGAVRHDGPLVRVDTSKAEPAVEGRVGRVAGVRSDGRPVVTFDSALPETVSISPTAIDDINSCPARHAYKSVLRLPTDPAPAAEVGTAYHSAMEQVAALPKAQRTPDAAAKAADTVLANMAAQGTLDRLGDDGPDKVRDLARRHFEVEDLSKVDVVAIERKVSATLPDGTRVTGKVDRVDRLADGSLAVTDLKSGRPPSGDSPAVIDQTMLYAAALRREGENVTKVRGVYPAGGVWEAEVTPQAIAAAENRATRAAATYRQGATSGQVLACPGGLCRRCDFKDRCPSSSA